MCVFFKEQEGFYAPTGNVLKKGKVQVQNGKNNFMCVGFSKELAQGVSYSTCMCILPPAGF
jgi:hypothetical protein